MTVSCGVSVMHGKAPKWWSIQSVLQAERWYNFGTSIMLTRRVLSRDLSDGGQ